MAHNLGCTCRSINGGFPLHGRCALAVHLRYGEIAGDRERWLELAVQDFCTYDFKENGVKRDDCERLTILRSYEDAFKHFYERFRAKHAMLDLMREIEMDRIKNGISRTMKDLGFIPNDSDDPTPDD